MTGTPPEGGALLPPSADGEERRLPLDPGSGGKRAIHVIVQIVLTGVVTVFVFRALGGTLEDALALDRALADPRPLPLLLATVVLFGGYAWAARLWGLMVGELGGRDPGPRLSVQLLLAANLGRYIPGKIWQLAGLAVLARRRGMSPAGATAAALLVQGFALAATATWGVPAFLAEGGVPGSGAARWALGILLVLVLLTSIPPVTHAATRLLFRLSRRDPEDAPRPGVGFGPRWLALNVLLWGVYGVAFHLFVSGLGFQIHPFESVTAFAAAYLVGNLFVPAPAGVGIREVALAGLLLDQLGPAAMAVAILARVWMTVVEVGPAAFFAWIEIRGMGR
jgi:glycosyltransferase 2 family protein